MGRSTTIALGRQVDPQVRRVVAAVLTKDCRRIRRNNTPAVQDLDDEELVWFLDYDRIGGYGFFSQPESECRSRRLDMRGPLDLDKGPIEMEESVSDPNSGTVILEFG